jgi:hypothetical protein
MHSFLFDPIQSKLAQLPFDWSGTSSLDATSTTIDALSQSYLKGQQTIQTQ